MKIVPTKALIVKDLISQLSYYNKLSGWFWYVDQYHKKRKGLIPKSIASKIRTIGKVYEYRDPSRKQIEIVADLILEDDFMEYVIDCVGVKVMEEISWCIGAVEISELEEKYDIDFFTNEAFDRKYKDKYAIFSTSNSYYVDYVFSIPSNILARYRQFFDPPALYYPSFVETISEQSYTKVNTEHGVHDLVAAIIDSSQHGLIKRGRTGNVLQSTYTMLQNKTDASRVFEPGTHKKLKWFRIKVLVDVITYINDGKGIGGSIEILKKVKNEVNSWARIMYDAVMCVYSGGKNSIYQKVDYSGFIYALTEHGRVSRGWIDPDNFYTYLTYHDAEIIPVSSAYHKLKVQVLDHRYYKHVPVTDNSLYTVFLIQYLKGALYFLASLGLVEILQDSDFVKLGARIGDDSCHIELPYNALQYFRLTTLGFHVFGIDSEYTLPESKFVPVEIVLSEQNLTISLSEKDDNLAKTLKTFSNQLGDRLFQVTKISFLHKIQFSSELNERIELLEKLTSGDVPQNWLAFLKSLDQTFNPLERVKGNFNLYKIPNDNPELLHQIMTDKSLRALYTKVDGRQLLVNRNDIVDFKNRMLKLGWVMEE